MKEEIEKIKNEMLNQDKRFTSFVYFTIHEDIKVYGADQEYADGRDRKEEHDEVLCDSCEACIEDGPEMPEDCDNCPDEAFNYYILKKEIPNMYAGFFFTAKAAEEHLKAKRHHYNETARVFGESACRNYELQTVMAHLVGEENILKLR